MKLLPISIHHSRILHLFILIGFSLPFFQTGCRESKLSDEAISAENKDINIDSQKIIDTIAANDKRKDTISSVNNAKEHVENNNSLASQLASKSRFLKMLLNPNEDVYTGLGLVVDTIEYLFYFAIFVALFLFATTFVSKLVYTTLNFQVLIYEILAFSFLLISQFRDFLVKIILGYWIVFFLAVLLIVLDVCLIFQKNRKI